MSVSSSWLGRTGKIRWHKARHEETKKLDCVLLGVLTNLVLTVQCDDFEKPSFLMMVAYV